MCHRTDTDAGPESEKELCPRDRNPGITAMNESSRQWRQMLSPRKRENAQLEEVGERDQKIEAVTYDNGKSQRPKINKRDCEGASKKEKEDYFGSVNQ